MNTVKRSNVRFYFALIVTLGVAALLVTGSSLLTMALDKGNSIPAGTLITWVGMISLPLTVYWGISDLRHPVKALHRILAVILKVIVVLGILWVPISYLLAGNLSFSFTERTEFQGGQLAMRIFWYLSYGIGIGTLLVLGIYWLSRLVRRR